MDYHAAIKAACALNGVGVCELSLQMGLNRNYLSSLKGRKVNSEILDEVARRLGMKVSELVALAERK